MYATPPLIAHIASNKTTNISMSYGLQIFLHKPNVPNDTVQDFLVTYVR